MRIIAMQLTPGTCELCAVTDQVLVAFGHAKIAAFLPESLKSLMGVSTIDGITSKLKVCSFCLAHMLQLVQYEQNLGTFSTLNHRCSICRNVEHLVKVTKWLHFDVLLENINAKRGKKCTVCLPCIAYLEQLNVVKGHFLKRVSKLQNSSFPITKERLDRQCKSPTGLSVELKSKRISKRTKTGLFLNNLKPLKYSDFEVDEYKNDARLLNQIAYVSLKKTLNDTQVKKTRKYQTKKKTIKVHENPVSTSLQLPFKIKLKSPDKKPTKSPRKQVTSKLRISQTKRGRKAQQNPKTKQLIVRILKTNFDELTSREQHEGDEAKSTDGDGEINLRMSPQNNNEEKVLSTDQLETDNSLERDCSEKSASELITNDETFKETLNRKRLLSTDELGAHSTKLPKIDAIDQEKNDASDSSEPVDALPAALPVKVDEDNVLKQPLAANGNETEDASSLECKLDGLENRHDKDKSSPCSDKTEICHNQLTCNNTKEISRSSSEDTVATLAEFREVHSALDVTSCKDAECGSDIEESQSTKNKETLEDPLTDENEKLLGAESAPKGDEKVEADNCETPSAKYDEDEEDDESLPDSLHVDNFLADNCEERNTKSLDDEEDDCFPESFQLHLGIEHIKDDNSTSTTANNGSDSVL